MVYSENPAPLKKSRMMSYLAMSVIALMFITVILAVNFKDNLVVIVPAVVFLIPLTFTLCAIYAKLKDDRREAEMRLLRPGPSETEMAEAQDARRRLRGSMTEVAILESQIRQLEESTIYIHPSVFSISQRHDPPPGYDHVTSNQRDYPVLSTHADIPNAGSLRDVRSPLGDDAASVHRADRGRGVSMGENDASLSVSEFLDHRQSINGNSINVAGGGPTADQESSNDHTCLPTYSEALEARIMEQIYTPSTTNQSRLTQHTETTPTTN